MAQHAQPRKVADLKGASRHDPQRYREPVESKEPLGDAPAHVTDAVRAVWAELVTNSLPGVLTGADRLVMETLSELVVMFREDPQAMPANKMTHMIGCMGRLGLSPADRQKFGGAKKEGNDFDQF